MITVPMTTTRPMIIQMKGTVDDSPVVVDGDEVEAKADGEADITAVEVIAGLVGREAICPVTVGVDKEGAAATVN